MQEQKHRISLIKQQASIQYKMDILQTEYYKIERELNKLSNRKRHKYRYKKDDTCCII